MNIASKSVCLEVRVRYDSSRWICWAHRVCFTLCSGPACTDKVSGRNPGKGGRCVRGPRWYTPPPCRVGRGSSARTSRHPAAPPPDCSVAQTSTACLDWRAGNILWHLSNHSFQMLKTHTKKIPKSRYLKYELFNPGSLRQKVKHGETRVGPNSRHGHPVASWRTASDVVRKSWKVFYECVHTTFIQTRHVDSVKTQQIQMCTLVVFVNRLKEVPLVSVVCFSCLKLLI